jgi:hypothetical protein
VSTEQMRKRGVEGERRGKERKVWVVLLATDPRGDVDGSIRRPN